MLTPDEERRRMIGMFAIVGVLCFLSFALGFVFGVNA